jgi:hypothetical protein
MHTRYIHTSIHTSQCTNAGRNVASLRRPERSQQGRQPRCLPLLHLRIQLRPHQPVALAVRARCHEAHCGSGDISSPRTDHAGARPHGLWEQAGSFNCREADVWHMVPCSHMSCSHMDMSYNQNWRAPRAGHAPSHWLLLIYCLHGQCRLCIWVQTIL